MKTGHSLSGEHSRAVLRFRLTFAAMFANPSDRCDLSRSTFGRLVARTRPSIAVANLLHD